MEAAQSKRLENLVPLKAKAARLLFQLRSHLVDAGLGAGFVLVAARRAGNADGADGVIADHDRQRTLRGYEIGEEEIPRIGIALDGVGKFSRRRARSASRIG